MSSCQQLYTFNFSCFLGWKVQENRKTDGFLVRKSYVQMLHPVPQKGSMNHQTENAQEAQTVLDEQLALEN